MDRIIAILFCFVLTLSSYSQGSKKIVTNYTGKVTSLKGVNSSENDFSIVVNKDKVYFASSRELDMIHYKENNWDKTQKISIYRGDVEALEDFYQVKVSNIEPFFEIRDERTHIGPICFSASGDTMFYTKVPTKYFDKTIKVFRPQLYMLTKSDGKWNKTGEMLPFNKPAFSFAHPTYDSKTNTLYFASDVKGGAGGKDIYSASIVNGKWTRIENLKKFNTRKDEVFPFISEDNILFFSSNRGESKGGLDIFYSELGAVSIRNMDFVNTETDDFGMFLVGGGKNMGFVSSNRNGKDDIFTITISEETNIRNSLFGKFKYRRLDEAVEQPLKVYLLNEKKEAIQETFVNENGEFEFFDLGLDENYTVQAKAKAEMDLVIYDSEGNPGDQLLANGDDEFVYEMVDINDVSDIKLTQMNEKGETVIEGRFLYEDNEYRETGELVVNLINSNGEVAHTAKSDSNGYFNFESLPNNQDYIVKLEKPDPELTLLIFNNDGKIVEKLKNDENGFYLFRQLKVLSIKSISEMSYLREDAFSFDSGIINGDFDRNGQDVDFDENLIISVYDENKELIDTIFSNENGAFKYEKLAGIENYDFQLDRMKSDFDLTGISLKIFDDNGNLIKEIKSGIDGSFNYRQLEILSIKELQAMSSLNEEAFSFDIGMINGDFDKNGEDIEFGEDLVISIYDKNKELVDTIRSNKRGAFRYKKLDKEGDYSFQLDRMRSDFDLSGISLKIVDDNGRVIKEIIPESNGSFEYRHLEILNIRALQAMASLDEGDFNLMDGESGTEILEGNIKYNNEKTQFPGGIEVSIYNKDKELQETKRTNINGDFTFRNLKSVDEYVIKISDKPENMEMSLFSIDLNTPNSATGKTILPSLSDGFVYNKLDALDNSEPLTSIAGLDESLNLIFEIKGNYDYDNKEGDFEEKLRVFAYDGNGNKIGEAFTDRFGNFVFNKLPGIATVLFKIEGMDENFDIDKFALYIEGDEGKQMAKLQSGEKGFFVFKPLGFASDIPDEITENIDKSTKHAIFGMNALDLSNDIESVYFGSNKANPNSSDLIKVEKMLLLLEINSSSTLEINAYADSRASDNYNLLLSEKRANWIKNYLVRKGIDNDRVVVNAYGEGKLVNDCKDGVDCPDMYHALNRRAEIRIIN
ncbi:MAG: OmpA family protein [Crocinitomicaceae bacterium]